MQYAFCRPIGVLMQRPPVPFRLGQRCSRYLVQKEWPFPLQPRGRVAVQGVANRASPKKGPAYAGLHQ